MSEFKKLELKEAVVVEGKYDKIHLQNVIFIGLYLFHGGVDVDE